MNSTKTHHPISSLVPVRSPIVGCWAADIPLETKFGRVVCHEELEFCADGTYHWRYRETDAPDQSQSGRYLVNENSITIVCRTNIAERCGYSIHSDKLAVYFEETDDTIEFTKK